MTAHAASTFTVYAFLATLAGGAVIGSVATWFHLCAGEERRAQLARDARLRVNGVSGTVVPFRPRSNCRRLDEETGA